MNAEVLFNILKEEGYKVEPDTYLEIEDALSEGRVRLLYLDDKLIGFFCWHNIYKEGKKHIYITHTVVKKGFRRLGNLLSLRKYFKYMGDHVFWRNDRRRRYFYAK